MSGGNQQKAIIAREIDKNPELLVAIQPTRGLDVGAIEYIHAQLVAQRDAGKAVLLVSLELDEVMNVSDRILVLYEGEIVGEFARGKQQSNNWAYIWLVPGAASERTRQKTREKQQPPGKDSFHDGQNQETHPEARF